MTPDVSDRYHIGFMFRTPIKGLVTDFLISKVTGAEYVHVDTVFIPPQPKKHRPIQEFQVLSTDPRMYFFGTM